MIAYHFPPIQGSSGIHRTVQFARHLPKFGWEPLIVSVHPRAYPAIGDDWKGGLSEKVVVKRAFALDSARHLSFKRRYLEITAIPDRWIGWYPGGVMESLKLVRRYKPQVVWSTFPVATAHLIGLTVHRFTGLPWIADFRDPMVQEVTNTSPLTRRVFQNLEKKVIKHAACCVMVTMSAMDDYANRHPGKCDGIWQLIENGYDESLFEHHGVSHVYEGQKCRKRPVTMVHSGILYAEGRNPKPFLTALKSFVHNSTADDIEVSFRGCGDEIEVQKWISDFGLDNIVKVRPPISYSAAIKEMVRADALIVFQGAIFQKQIPAKVYEYIRAGKPILAMTDQKGETARFLRKWDGVYFGDMSSPENIENALNRLVNNIRSDKKPVRRPDEVMALSRLSKTRKLASILDNVMQPSLRNVQVI